MVYDVKSKQRLFKSVFRDATAMVTKLFYVAEFEDDVDFDEEFAEDEANRFMDDEIVGDEVVQPKIFKGYFLFVENSISKP